MKTKFFFVFFVVFAIGVTPDAYSHKPISPTDKNTSLETALNIPDHQISWVIYETLDPYQHKYYSFTALKGDSFFASINIPKIERFENFTPNMGLVFENDVLGSNSPESIIEKSSLISKYEGPIPSTEFYEPFGQATYWERQEIKLTIPQDGKYYIDIFDTQGVSGKLSFAIGTIEDFSILDFFTVLPLAWIETKIFFEDYLSLFIFFGLVAGIISLVITRKLQTRRKTKPIL